MEVGDVLLIHTLCLEPNETLGGEENKVFFNSIKR